jgi:hypothetical protein
MQQVITRTTEITLADDGILRTRIFEDANITLKDVEEYYAFTRRMTGGAKILAIVDGRSHFTITDDARVFAAKESENVRVATALITRSAAIRVLYNIYMQLNKPKSPARMFSDEESAVKWLRTFIQPGYGTLSGNSKG